jgi:nicotinamide mononucleotide adenylyltransferase
MKSFLQFLSEASKSLAVQQASRLGLTGDGHGGWYDKNGEFTAKTEGGKLKFYNKNQKIGKQDPPQEKKVKDQEIPKEVQSQQEPQVEGPPPVPKTKGTLTIAFGRFNPPTTGHEKLLNTVATSSDDGDYIIVPSRSQDKKKNPLDADTKVSVMRQMFPQHSERIINDQANRTIFDVLKKAHMDGYTNVSIVGGADRVNEFEKLSNNYNGKLYQFDNLEVRSAGERDPDSEDDVSGMSASKQRKAAAEGDFKTFRKGVPSTFNEKQAKELYNTIRAAMNIKEGWNLWEIAPKLDWKNLRENYIQENIFRIGDIVENLNTGLVGRIIRRGTNYLICVTEDSIMFKCWIKDVVESKKAADKEDHKPVSYGAFVPQTRNIQSGFTNKSGVPADQREVGTDAYREYTMKMTGTKEIKNFINKYKKK